MTAEELDEYFDNGGDSTPFMVEGSAYRPAFEKPPRRVNLLFPAWMIDVLDEEAKRLGITRQALVLVWLAERIKGEGLLDGRPVG